ncbi:ferrous iron transport peroxidase EfeB [Aquitalea magnusonii]|uniref:Deferrochelatase n=1 Tax=Aquitalea magnusonii TaxID=332411 RepID=A0A3G9GI53_9NEIS|nr:iron uptake transporter deferrochelatase/peroxidase subunit [Aquitalea magnusonii]BBF85782.1 ferrous iron transport peroxidase EfeB [Aquitalea magnusonii]
MTEQDKPATAATSAIANPQRRSLLRGAGLFGGGLLAGGLGSAAWFGKLASPADPASEVVPYRGAHQAGITTPAPQEAIFIAFDVLAKDRQGLQQTLQLLTERIAFLTRGGPAAVSPPKLPPPDSGLLGDTVSPDRLTITVAVGASLFDGRFGLQAQRPQHLSQMPAFPNDALDAAWCDGDLLLQCCANARETVIHAVRDIIKHCPDKLAARWKMDGFQPAGAVRHNSTPINLFGFKDGTGNPDSADAAQMNALVWVDDKDKEPAWAKGGSYVAIRLIRFTLEQWDRTPLGEQQGIFGRDKSSGAPLGKQHEFDDPDFAADPHGQHVPLDSHMRRAEPRQHGRHDARLLRRSYSYSLGLTKSGQLDMGLVFICFQSNLQTGFIATQKRLNGEPLEEYIKPFGGGYFFALPGVEGNGWLGQSLLQATA